MILFFYVVLAVSSGTANNAGAILVLGRDLVVVPKLIHPIPPAISSPEASPERHIEDTWMQVRLILLLIFVLFLDLCSVHFLRFHSISVDFIFIP